MYQAYFGLRDYPFTITPDPSYLYLSPHHQEALAHLLYGMQENGGFVQLTGEVGTGKTTLIRSLVAQHIENVEVALCLNPCLTVQEFVAAILDELKIGYPRECQSLKPLIDALNAHLLEAHAQGRHTVLIIDEAQNLSQDVLEQVRLLTNLETRRHKLLRIIVVGQPELLRLLAKPQLRQLAQRITARYHLPPLSRSETLSYIEHRLQVAGASRRLFTRPALNAIYRAARGIPRLINIICDRALLGAYVRGRQCANLGIVESAAREVLRGTTSSRPLRLASWLTLTTALATALALGVGLQSLPLGSPPPAKPVVPAAASTAAAKLALGAVVDLAGLLSSDLMADGALERLLRLWEEDPKLATVDDPCQQLSARQLRCLSGQTDWAKLRSYNRPALIQLVAQDGATRSVLLRSLVDDKAILDLGERSVEVALAELDPLWTGEFLLLWRPPVAEPLIGPGSRGEPVAWLRRQLALAEKRALAEPLSERFDAGLQEQVRRFQRSRDLQVDGVVGVHTMLLLSNLAPLPGTPVLNPTPIDKV